jgi:hypothetical protein
VIVRLELLKCQRKNLKVAGREDYEVRNLNVVKLEASLPAKDCEFSKQFYQERKRRPVPRSYNGLRMGSVLTLSNFCANGLDELIDGHGTNSYNSGDPRLQRSATGKLLEQFMAQGQLAASIYYSWDGDVPAQNENQGTPLRCGALIEAGKLTLSPIEAASIGEDITDQKRTEPRIKRLNRVYTVLSGINSLIVRARPRQCYVNGD